MSLREIKATGKSIMTPPGSKPSGHIHRKSLENSRNYKQTPSHSFNSWSAWLPPPSPSPACPLREPSPVSPHSFYSLPVQMLSDASSVVRGPLTAGAHLLLLPSASPSSSGTSCLSSFPIFVVLVTWPDS